MKTASQYPAWELEVGESLPLIHVGEKPLTMRQDTSLRARIRNIAKYHDCLVSIAKLPGGLDYRVTRRT
jgi:hypothetical protein